jgi:general secretion pathway protein K
MRVPAALRGDDMAQLRLRSDQTAPNGFILVAVLWILGALATLAAIYAVYVREAAVASADYDDRLRAEGLALAGVELAVYQLRAEPDARPSAGSFNFRLGAADVSVEYRSEAARIDLNFAPKLILSGLLAAACGASNTDAANIADGIIAWRTPPTAATTDNQASRSLSRQGPFQHINEVSLVPGMTPALTDCVLPFLTVYSGQAGVDVLNAAPEVIAALPGVTPERLHALIGLRQGASLDILRAQLGMARALGSRRASPGWRRRAVPHAVLA